MPEGDTVFRTARRLHDALADGTVTRFDIRVPGSATADLRGETVHAVVARGKHLLMRIGGATLHSHLRMEGEWHLYRPGERWRRPGFRARAIVGTDAAEAVGFDLGMVDVIPSSEEERLVGHLGPDPLSPGWDDAAAADAAGRIASDARPVHVALLDQRNVAGFGTEYAAELLFLRGILPTRPASGVDASSLIDLGARMLRGNTARAVRTFSGDTRRGRERWVYGRDRQPCRRCGAPIRRGSLGPDAARERLVYWCPDCQT